LFEKTDLWANFKGTYLGRWRQVSRKPSTKPRTTIKRLADGHRRKRSPNGVRSTFLAIQYYWLSLITGKLQDEHLTPLAFSADKRGGFEKIFNETFNRYPAMKHRPDKLHRLLQQLTSGQHNIEFVHLLAFAEYVGLPLSLFLLFTQMVSDESRSIGSTSDFRAHALRTLGRVKLVVELAEKQVTDAVSGEKIFIHEYDEFDEPGVIMAKARALKSWSDLYHSAEAQGAAKDATISVVPKRD
jgi:hypothetical protein